MVGAIAYLFSSEHPPSPAIAGLGVLVVHHACVFCTVMTSRP